MELSPWRKKLGQGFRIFDQVKAQGDLSILGFVPAFQDPAAGLVLKGCGMQDQTA